MYMVVFSAMSRGTAVLKSFLPTVWKMPLTSSLSTSKGWKFSKIGRRRCLGIPESFIKQKYNKRKLG